MHPRPGEVWLADLGLAAKYRPVVIVSRHDPDVPRALCMYVPITTQSHGSQYEAPLSTSRLLKEESVANVQGLASLPTVRLGRRLGSLSVESLAKIRAAIVWMLELSSGQA
jgi:mRNA interferase MazF